MILDDGNSVHVLCNLNGIPERVRMPESGSPRWLNRFGTPISLGNSAEGLDQRAMQTATRCSLRLKYNLTGRRVATPLIQHRLDAKNKSGRQGSVCASFPAKDVEVQAVGQQTHGTRERLGAVAEGPDHRRHWVEVVRRGAHREPKLRV